ncbi:imm11 family protein [Pyxidicoccus sp. 3LG]
MRFFNLREDLYVPGRWYLDTPVDAQGQEVGSWLFTQGQPASVDEPLRVALYRPGKALDFSMADAGTVPVVHPRVAAVFQSLAPGDIQTYPIDVEGQPEPYVLVNAARLVKCIDDQASERVTRWIPKDENDQPELAGQYRNVVGMRIDKSCVGDARLFRPWGWPVSLVVSEDIKEALERTGASGMKFTEV